MASVYFIAPIAINNIRLPCQYHLQCSLAGGAGANAERRVKITEHQMTIMPDVVVVVVLSLGKLKL